MLFKDGVDAANFKKLKSFPHRRARIVSLRRRRIPFPQFRIVGL
jgi:hypothetical protein